MFINIKHIRLQELINPTMSLCSRLKNIIKMKSHKIQVSVLKII